ncbi:MAG: protein arginine kinase [Bacillota bacterium]|nr:protein arginine kinase [Bacillota bacterium]
MSEYRTFNQFGSYWMMSCGAESDVVISSRIRLGRNLAGYPFKDMISLQQEREILEKVQELPRRQQKNGVDDLEFIDLSLIPGEEKMVLLEKHLISPEMAVSQGATGLLLNASETLAVMVNEEDHLRIQSLYPGLSLKEALAKADSMDDLISKYLTPSFSRKWGYLTSCPSNTGTGMRASVMLHLPAMVWTGQINRWLGNLHKFGFTYRGLYGEGTESHGNLFQISNQVTLGVSEAETLEELIDNVMVIVDREREIRHNIMKKDPLALEDKVFRAEAILKNAKLISTEEGFKLLSDLRFGIDMGLLPHYEPKLFNELMIKMQPPVLTKMSHRPLTKEEMWGARAELMNTKLKEAE